MLWVLIRSASPNICCGYSLEVPHRGTSNEYPQHMFSSRNKKNTDNFWLKKVPYQELWRSKKKYQYFLLEKNSLSGAVKTYCIYSKNLDRHV